MPKKKKSMLEVSKGYEEFIKGKEINTNRKIIFEKALKNAIKNKSKTK